MKSFCSRSLHEGPSRHDPREGFVSTNRVDTWWLLPRLRENVLGEPEVSMALLVFLRIVILRRWLEKPGGA
jgi:hypothetical protein